MNEDWLVAIVCGLEKTGGTKRCQVCHPPPFCIQSKSLFKAQAIRFFPFQGHSVLKKRKPLKFQNNLLPSGEKSRTAQTYVINSVDRHDAGIYSCEARNGVVGKQRAQTSIQLQVLCE